MSEADKIGDTARELFLRAEESAHTLKKELLQIEHRAQAIKRELDEADRAKDRFLSFAARADGSFQCPRCWINSAKETVLVMMSGREGAGFLKCETCNLRIALPARD